MLYYYCIRLTWYDIYIDLGQPAQYHFDIVYQIRQCYGCFVESNSMVTQTSEALQGSITAAQIDEIVTIVSSDEAIIDLAPTLRVLTSEVTI